MRDGRVYYDVEGELPGDVEIEFDVLMTEQGPKIVEIQRDIVWSVFRKTPARLSMSQIRTILKLLELLRACRQITPSFMRSLSQVTAMDRALKCKPKQEKFICSQSAGNIKPDGLVFWRYA